MTTNGTCTQPGKISICPLHNTKNYIGSPSPCTLISNAIPNLSITKSGRKGTTQYQKHEPSGFCYTIKCMDETIYKDKTVLYAAKMDGEDIGKKFVEHLENDLKEIYEILKTTKPIKISEEEELSFQQAKICYACKRELVHLDRPGGELHDYRVRDHCHLTGKYCIGEPRTRIVISK